MGHGGRAGLTLPEGLAQLGDLRVLQVADLHGHALDGAAGHGHRSEEGRVAIALHHLRAREIRAQAEPRESAGLDRRRQLRVGPDGTGDLAGGQVVGREAQARAGTIELEGPRGQLEPEGQGLGVDTVGPAHLQRLGMLARPGHDRGDRGVEAIEDEVGGLAALQRQAGIDHVAAGEAPVDVAALRAHRLGHLGHEGNHVVIGGALELVDAIDVDRGARCDGGHRVSRYLARVGQCLQHRDLHAQQVFEPTAVGPQRRHLRQRVALDHAFARGRR